MKRIWSKREFFENESPWMNDYINKAFHRSGKDAFNDDDYFIMLNDGTFKVKNIENEGRISSDDFNATTSKDLGNDKPKNLKENVKTPLMDKVMDFLENPSKTSNNILKNHLKRYFNFSEKDSKSFLNKFSRKVNKFYKKMDVLNSRKWLEDRVERLLNGRIKSIDLIKENIGKVQKVIKFNFTPQKFESLFKKVTALKDIEAMADLVELFLV